MNALAVNGLGVSLGQRVIFKDISFDAEAGDWLGLVGANGSGKTTLLRCLAGRMSPSAGRIVLSRRDCSNDLGARSRFFGFSTDIGRMPGEFTPEELINLLSVVRRPQPVEPFWSILEMSRLIGCPIGRMSSGMKQRVSIYLAFLGEPSAVILDEPFNWLDPVASYELKRALEDYTARGGVLLTALHDIATFSSHCSKGIVLSEGQLVRRYRFGDAPRSAAEIERDIYSALSKRAL